MPSLSVRGGGNVLPMKSLVSDSTGQDAQFPEKEEGVTGIIVMMSNFENTALGGDFEGTIYSRLT